MPPISVLLKPVSGACNMRCDYCFYCDEMKNRAQAFYGEMSTETLKNVIRKTMLCADNSISYAFQGGEPTLRGLPFFESAMAFQRQFNQKGIRVYNALQTNGYALDEAWCRFLKENHFLVGVSVDGTAEIHDCHRHSAGGQPSFARIMQSIRLLERFAVDYNILTVVTREIAEQINTVYDFYKKQGWHYQQYLLCLSPLHDSHTELQPREYGTFLMQLFDLWYNDWKKGCQPFIRQFENYIAMCVGYEPEACDQRGTCGMQTVVEADGSVYPCDFYVLDAYRLGNFNTDRLVHIDQKRRELQFIEQSRKMDQSCLECPYVKLCRGGCRRNRIFDNETGNSRNIYCEGYRMFFEYTWTRMQEIAAHVRKIHHISF